MTAEQSCEYALRFILLSYGEAKDIELTPPVQALIASARRSAALLASGVVSTPEAFLPEDRLTVRSCLRAMDEVVLASHDREFDMLAYGLGPAPELAEFRAALDWIAGVGVGA